MHPTTHLGDGNTACSLHRPCPPPQKQFIRCCHPYARKSASQAVFSRMQLTLHATRRTPHDASRLVLAMSAWSAKTRRAPSRHSRDARVYGHTTTVVHDMSTPAPHTGEAHKTITYRHRLKSRRHHLKLVKGDAIVRRMSKPRTVLSPRTFFSSKQTCQQPIRQSKAANHGQ